ncbi:MAG: hypothetical protein M1823_004698 [Watsoniomyces obsoletus]|nr:MAG: hypothetical protein M1823_004698 [Watsoniomyces obsoletus]
MADRPERPVSPASEEDEDIFYMEMEEPTEEQINPPQMLEEVLVLYPRPAPPPGAIRVEIANNIARSPYAPLDSIDSDEESEAGDDSGNESDTPLLNGVRAAQDDGSGSGTPRVNGVVRVQHDQVEPETGSAGNQSPAEESVAESDSDSTIILNEVVTDQDDEVESDTPRVNGIMTTEERLDRDQRR